MLTQARQFLRIHPGRRLIAVFCATILLPGMLLAYFSFRALEQERRLFDQQIRERLDRAAERAARELEEQLRRWRRTTAELTPAGAADALPDPGSGVAVFLNLPGPRAVPPGRLLYELGPVEAARKDRHLPPAFAAAETEELRRKNLARAAALYRDALHETPPDLRPLVLHRLARTWRKLGRREEAIRAYRQLEAAGPFRIAGVPADLVARYELGSLEPQNEAAAVALYRDLVNGRWRLEKMHYLFYSEAVRGRLARDPAGWVETEQGRMTLTRAAELAPACSAPVETVWADDQPHLVFSSGEKRLVLSAGHLGSAFWPKAFASLAAEDLAAAVSGPNGAALFGASPRGARHSAARAVEESGLRWRLAVWPRNPDAVAADWARRRTLYQAMLLLVVALLGFGSYLTVRTLRREMEIARLKSLFVSAVSHEFRSPLTGIRQLGEMLMRGRVAGEERRQEYYRLITRESDRLSRLVENVLDFSRMEEGRRTYRFAPLDAAGWLREVVSEFQSGVADTGVEVSASVPDDLGPLTGDREALSCAVHNLLDNAVKYSPGSNTVWLEAGAADGRISIRVRDRGMGIPEQDQRHIFEKFYRGGGEAGEKVKGVGLGLSLVKHIVSAHGGTVEFESRAGEGSTFCIHLKAAERS